MYYPLVTPPPLEFGVAFHAAMEEWYRPEFWQKPTQLDVALQRFKMECDAQLKRYKRLNPNPDQEKVNEYKERIELGLNMIRHYCENMSPEYDNGFTPIKVEIEFEVPITGPTGEWVWCKCDQCWRRYNAYENLILGAEAYRNGAWPGLPVTYGGRLDMLAKDDLGRFWVYDWKTTARLLNEGKEESFLELDDQVSSYLWALTYYNIRCAGFVYVEIKKEYPKIPRRLDKTRQYRSFSTDRNTLTTYEMARKTFDEQDHEVYTQGFYDDYLNWLRLDGPRFTQRHQIHKNDYEINQIGLNIYYEAQDIVNSPLIYPTPGRFSCPSCMYRQVCLGMNQGEDYKYTLNTMFEKKEKHYYEEQKPSTE